MKKLLLLFAVIVLTGAGCFGRSPAPEQATEAEVPSVSVIEEDLSEEEEAEMDKKEDGEEMADEETSTIPDNSIKNESALANQEDKVVQQPACNQDIVSPWQLVGGQVYFIVESDCRISKFCDINNNIHTTGSVKGSKIIIDGITTKEYVLSGGSLTLLNAGGNGEDLPFMRLYSTTPIPESC